MTGRIITVLLYAGVGTAGFSTLGLLVMRNVNEKLHYLAPSSTFSVFLIAFAIALEEGWAQATGKAIFCAIALALMNPVLTHATARAARIRELGRWQSPPEKRQPERQAGD